MNYEAWRISFQDSEQAAKAAFEESQRYKRMFDMAINSVVELAEAAGIPKENQLTGGNFQALNAIEKLKERREKWKARALKAEKDRDAYLIAEQRQIALRQKVEAERDVLAAYQTDLIRELTACQSVLHMLAHDRQVTPAYANDAKAVLRRAPEACLAKRDALSQSEGLKKAAIFIEQKANSYDAEHGKTDPSTNHREYPGDGAEYYNDLMELADELRRQANGEPGGAAWTS
jgi:hypothetical protein